MGDFLPSNNIMVSLNKKGELEHIYILDWELSYWVSKSDS